MITMKALFFILSFLKYNCKDSVRSIFMAKHYRMMILRA